MRAFRQLHSQETGFTLVELLVVVGIIVIIVGLTIINLGQPQTTTSLATTVDSLIADIKSQQLLAMTGDIGSTTAQQPHGIYFQASKYTLFAGAAYSGADTNNFIVNAPQSSTFSTTFPSSIVLFNKGPGDINGYTAGSNTITITNGNSSKTITLTRFGATAVN